MLKLSVQVSECKPLTVGSFGGHHELPAAAPLPVIRLRKQGGGGTSETLGLPVLPASLQYQALVAVSRVICDAYRHSCLTPPV